MRRTLDRSAGSSPGLRAGGRRRWRAGNRRPHRLGAVMDSRVDRSGRDPEDRSDLRAGKPDVMGEHERGSLLDRESQEGSLQLVPIDELAEPVVDRRFLDRGDIDLHRASSTAPDLVVAGADDETVEPGIEPVTVAQPAEVSP